MFQNISGINNEEDIEIEEQYNEDNGKTSKIKMFFKDAFTKQKIALYILSFMISTISGINGICPFAISMFAAVLSNKIPALIVYILTLIGTYARAWNRTSIELFSNIPCIYSNDSNI